MATLGFTLAGCATADKRAVTPGAPGADREASAWVRSTMDQLSLEERVGQLFMIWVRSEFLNVESPEYQALRESMRRYHVGGLAMTVPVRGPVLVKSRPEEAALLLNRLQQESKWPLLVAADFEVGVASRLDGATAFPQAMAFGAAGKVEHARAFGRITAREARAIGVHWNFVPVADVNSNPANPIINTRSFGEDPQQVGELVAAYVEGAHEGGMLTTAKHFPGHGDTATDSHYGVAQVTGDLARLEAVELPPFRRAIEAGVDSVMVAHVTVPAIEPSPDKVATTSAAVVTDLLKTRLGFGGVVVTDALDMAALTKKYAPDVGRAAVDAFKAGNDYLIIPADFPASWRAMVEAVKSGEISTARLDEAVLKILRWKAALGLHRNRRRGRLTGARARGAAGGRRGRPADRRRRRRPRARRHGRAAPRGRAHGGGRPALSHVGRDAEPTPRGRALPRRLRPVGSGLRPRDPPARSRRARRRAGPEAPRRGRRRSCWARRPRPRSVVVAAFVAPEPGEAEAGAGHGDPAGRLLQQILDRAADKTVVVAAGSPYVAQAFPEIRSYLCTFSSAAVSERSAVRALFGEIPTRGRLPVTIPGVAARGDGITR